MLASAGDQDMDTTADQIESVRREWGTRLLILGHHYQDSAVLRHADVTGDSLELSRQAGASPAERIVFCGVHFMAESADILTAPEQTVYMPDTSAGCPMADMAEISQVERAWPVLQGHGGDWLPVVYVNSTAALKAFVGRQGGSTCTSSNAPKVFRWVTDQNRRVFFLPDRHLGTNTARDLGVPDDRVAVYNPRLPDGGLAAADFRRARVVVWDGFCPIHTVFTLDQVREIREREPQATIIVHPETPIEVTQLCDAHGSTAQIIKWVEAAAPGTVVYVGTEAHLVRRLAEQHRARGVDVRVLRHSVCPNMARTNARNLLAVLRDWPERNVVRVPAPFVPEARLALERMLRL
jgi:quinolinate synthase